MELITIVIGVAALVLGIVAGKFIFAKDTQRKIDEANLGAQKILADAQTGAENLKKEAETAKSLMNALITASLTDEVQKVKTP